MIAPDVLSLREFGELVPSGRSIVTIGNFDGVHVGHRRIISTARELAHRREARVAALTFEPHPTAVLAPQRAPARLTTAAERAYLLQAAGADSVITLASVPALFELTAEDFLARLIRALRPAAFVEGTAFRFGRDRSGTIETLRAHAAANNFEVMTIEPVTAATSSGVAAVSSTTIRNALADGRLTDAMALLLRPHRIVGVVRSGDGRGSTIGFPTANLHNIRQMTPGFGVYAAFAQTTDGLLRPAAVNIGPQPTFGQSAARVEAHLLDFDRDLREAALGLHLVARLREQRKFDGPEELAAQLRHDVTAIRALLERTPTPSAFPL